MCTATTETGKRIAVITGASSGMGREFVLALDREEKYDELWVIARRREKLEELASLTRAKHKKKQAKKLKIAKKAGYDPKTGFYKLMKADKIKTAKKVKFKKTKKK